MADEHLNDLVKKQSSHFSPNILVKSWGLDIWFMLGFVLVTILSIYTPPLDTTVVRLILVFVMVMLMPGYAMMAAIFPGKAEIGFAERTVLSIVLSIVMVPLMGFALNFTTWGIRLNDMVISITVFIVLFSAVAVWRRRKIPTEEYADIIKQLNILLTGIFSTSNRKLDKVLTVFVFVAILMMAGTLAYYAIAPMPGEQFTEFYVLGMDGKAANYSMNYYLGDEKPVIVGIANHELRNVTYDLAITLSDGTNNSTLYSERVTLSDNQTMEKAISIKPNLLGDHLKLEFKLYKDGDLSSPYRDLYLWANVASPGVKAPWDTSNATANSTASNVTAVPVEPQAFLGSNNMTANSTASNVTMGPVQPSVP